MVTFKLLDTAVAARKRLGDSDDSEAVHDFRVAVRRLRSWLRAFDPWVSDSVPRKARRRLRKSARLTGQSRDAEVHLDWLREQKRELSHRQRVGLVWISSRIEAEKAAADRTLISDATRAFDRAHRRLRDSLAAYRAYIDLDGEESTRTFAAVLASLLRDQAAVLARRLRKVQGIDDETRSHNARIAAKRLRYLLEPVADDLAGGAALVEDLSALQDTLGDWRDGRVFAATIVEASEQAAAEEAHRVSEAVMGGEPPADAVRAERDRDVTLGLLALAGRLHERVEHAFADAQNRWLGAGDALVARVEEVAAELERRGHSREIERKFLLRAVPERAREADASEIEQGYLPGTSVVERLRLIQGAEGDPRHLRTVKLGDGMSRTEVEEEVTAELFGRLWPLTEGQRVRKRRYALHADDHTWEVDEFLDRELVLAEVELDAADEEVAIPKWLEEVLVREVTGESEFENAQLAR